MSVTDTPSNEAQGPVDDSEAANAAVNEPPRAPSTAAADQALQALSAEGAEPSAAEDAAQAPDEAPSATTDGQQLISAEEPPAGEPDAVPAPDAPAAPVTSREQGLSPAQTAARLAELFPALFGSAPKPIKLRIQVDIQQRAPGIFTKRVMSIVLSRHTTTTPYLKALVAETQRYDLDGQPAGDVAAEHKQAAVDELARRRQIVDERRAAERAARNPRPPRGPQRPAGEPTGAAAAEGASPNAAEGAPTQDRPPRPPRQDPWPRNAVGFSDNRPPRQDRQDRPGRPGERTAGPRPQGRAEGARGRPPERGNRPQQQRSPRDGANAPRAHTPHPNTMGNGGPAAREWAPVDPAQRERAFLLRAWESSSLTKANFCVLKRMTEVEFDAQLDQARQERSAARSG